MDVKHKIVDLISEGESVIQISKNDGLYDRPFFTGEEYEKWINKCIYFMEKYFKGSKWYERFIRASESAVGNGEEYYNTMIGVLKAIMESEDLGSLHKKEKEKNKKIFVSHSSKNRNITDEFVELLKVIGVKNNQIYYSSYEETGVNFLQDCFERINEEFTNNELLVIFMISREFYSSRICLAETGATWVSAANRYIPIIMPPYDYNNIEGVINATQAAITLSDKNISTKLEKFKIDIEKFLGIENQINAEEWVRKKEKFIKNINDIAEKLDDVEGKIIDITLEKNNSNTNIMIKVNLINNTRNRTKLEELNIELMIDKEIEKVCLNDWSVQALVLQPLEEITVYMSINISREIKRSKVNINDSSVKLNYYQEN